jgi:hypothetical protein
MQMAKVDAPEVQYVAPDIACCECGGEVQVSRVDPGKGKCLTCAIDLIIVKPERPDRKS